MTQINDNELERICQFLTLETPPFYSEVLKYLCDVYVTGCRATEPLLYNRWSWNDPDSDHVTLDPLKLSNDRVFKKAMLSDSLLLAIENQIAPYGGLTLRQLEYSMRQVSSFGTVSLEERYTIAYIYRYNKVRELIRDGMTQAQVDSYFGWLNAAMSERYTDANLYVLNYVIPTETYYLSNINNFQLVDSNGDMIVSE
jgi:hypothetical protein